ncbi:hypothetical protein CR513_57767, partial [Mucuna pruriens]
MPHNSTRVPKRGKRRGLVQFSSHFRSFHRGVLDPENPNREVDSRRSSRPTRRVDHDRLIGDKTTDDHPMKYGGKGADCNKGPRHDFGVPSPPYPGDGQRPGQRAHEKGEKHTMLTGANLTPLGRKRSSGSVIIPHKVYKI